MRSNHRIRTNLKKIIMSNSQPKKIIRDKIEKNKFNKKEKKNIDLKRMRNIFDIKKSNQIIKDEIEK